jgi:hypothetical protein
MSEARLLTGVPGVNGTARRSGRKAEGKPRSSSRRSMRAAKRLAAVCGCVATGVLALSVVHCTQTIVGLTGSHWLLSALLAIGIDAGMVASEVGEVASHGTSAERTVGRWARGYTLAAIVLSMLLNGYAFAQHASGALTFAAAALGIIIPGLVYGLGRVAAHLWRAGE